MYRKQEIRSALKKVMEEHDIEDVSFIPDVLAELDETTVEVVMEEDDGEEELLG